MTAADLRKAEARYQRAFARSEAERETRNEAFALAFREGWGKSHIAEATGLTRSRIGQILNEEKP